MKIKCVITVQDLYEECTCYVVNKIINMQDVEELKDISVLISVRSKGLFNRVLNRQKVETLEDISVL